MSTTATVTPQSERTIPRPLTDDALHQLDAYWRAANYLSVGQIYLLANPLLSRFPLQRRIELPVAVDRAWNLEARGSEKADVLANRAVDLAPWSPSSIDTLAVIAAKLGRCREATRLEQRSLEIRSLRVADCRINVGFTRSDVLPL